MIPSRYSFPTERFRYGHGTIKCHTDKSKDSENVKWSNMFNRAITDKPKRMLYDSWLVVNYSEQKKLKSDLFC